jgi:hypothetical protein
MEERDASAGASRGDRGTPCGLRWRIMKLKVKAGRMFFFEKKNQKTFVNFAWV